MGHASVTITMDIYSRALPGIQRDAAEKISTGLSDSREDLVLCSVPYVYGEARRTAPTHGRNGERRGAEPLARECESLP